DDATLAALDALDLPPEFEIVRVPPMQPRTKPKALHYALSGVSGSYLVIYDAEDRPHPDQLLEAYAIFSRAPETLAVLQAPLIIHNSARNWLSGLFALEYAALFRGLLPMLARFGLPLPLGGTSNHFRVSALRECGAWDPHNVTEDADLGLRLFRRGYRGGVLSLWTMEEAPETLPVWMRQRTRWFKGWLQTWLVLMRAPLRLRRELGTGGFAVFQVLIAGMLCSALAHPLLVVFVAAFALHAAGSGMVTGAGLDRLLFGADIWNLVGGYAVFLLLGWRAMTGEERRRVGPKWMAILPYWLAMSAASWLALFELMRKPFYWAKTPHSPTRAYSFTSPVSSSEASTGFDSAECS
ncbi:MAG: glycosyltransferase family 2 protein, partial [Pararhizobium sp.]